MKSNEDYIASLENEIANLKDQNAKLNNIIHKAPIPIFVVDQDHTITHFNQALEDLSGLAADDMIDTKEQWKAFYSSERPIMADLIIEQSSDSRIFEHYGQKYEVTSKDKDRFAATDFFPDLGDDGRWLFFTASTFTDSKNSIAGAIETLQDVTKEKNAEREKDEVFKTHQKILEFIPYPIVVYNEKGLVSYNNPSFTATFGWTLDELKGKEVPFVPEHLEEQTSDMVDRFIKDKTLARYETKRLTKDGKVLDVILWAASHSRNDGGSLDNFVIMRDITEEKRLEANNKTIMRISAVLPEYPELEDLMNYISMEVKNVLNTEGALVLLYDEIKDELFFTGGAYDDSDTLERVQTVRFPADSILAGKIVKTGEYALVNDAEKLMKDYPERDERLGYETRNLLEVPIINEDRIIGVLCAINKKENDFEYNDMELMTMIAGTCALSIENARFSEALKEAYRDVASMNRAKGKAINHLSHELKTPVAILTGSLGIIRKKIKAAPDIKLETSLERIERNLDRIVDIQSEVADIMDGKNLSTQRLLLKMFETCQDELEILIHQNLDPNKDRGNSDFQKLETSVTQLIDEKFGPRTLEFKSIDFSEYFTNLYSTMTPEFDFRQIDMGVHIDKKLPSLLLPVEVLDKSMSGIIKNAIENTPEKGKIDISITKKGAGILFKVHDFGVGIERDFRKRIFEGFFATQETLLYSTKQPFAFNAGGKGADLLRTKIFSDRHGFTLTMSSDRCGFLVENEDYECPGDIDQCKFCNCQADCLNSGQSIFEIFFPIAEK